VKPATHWRVLNYLYHHKLFTVRPRLDDVRRSQNVSYDDLVDLDMSALITATIEDTEVSLRNLIRFGPGRSEFAKKIRVRLTGYGLKTVLDDPGNQIRYTLGQHSGPVSVARLFVETTIVIDDVIAAQKRGLISVELPECGEIELTGGLHLFGEIFKVTLTAKGREYLPF
jgi:hypothetical protein